MAIADQDAPGTAEPTTEERPDAFVSYWVGQLKAYDDEFKSWTDRCKKIVRRFRDERSEKNDGTPVGGARFNALWANVQTLQPAIYINAPKPVAERRYLDKDPLARLASMTLERALEVQIDVGYLHSTMQQTVLDYLLCGRGTSWERYEPTYGEPVDVVDTENEEEQAEGDQPREVTYEKVCTDYVAWNKFRHSPAATWADVWWVAKEEMLTRKELRARFKEKDKATGKLIADLIPLRDGSEDKQNDREKKRKQPRACIQEIWNKNDREVIFIAPDWPNGPLERAPDPLHLADFWPCQKPLYATMTNDCLVPVPDYVEYQDQADELDNLTNRIQALTDAVRVNGVYDASYPELKRILQEGVDNRMIGVKNYAEFAQKGGLDAAMDFVPIKDVVEALIQLYDARERTKQVMYEITGISDIIRGQSDPNETLGAQKIKGNFATLRLEDRKKEVARFARDAIRIKAEIIAEQFSPETLAEMTGMLPVILEEIKNDSPPPQPPMMGHNGGPPMEAAPAGSPPLGNGAPGGPLPPAAGQQPMQPPPPDPQMLAQQKFQEICSLLRDDKMRTFRIDIETDSTIELDKTSEKQAVVELFTAVGGFLEKAIPVGQTMPQLTPALGQSILFAFRRFGAGRDVEAVWEQAIDQLTQMAKNPPPKPPSPEEIKAQAEVQKQQMESQRQQQQAEIDRQQAQMEMAAEQQKAQLDLQKGQQELALDQARLQLEREKMDMERQKMAMEIQAGQQKAQIEGEAMQRKAALDERADIRGHELAEAAAEREAAAGEHDFELGEKVREAKAKEAMKPKPKGKGK